MYAETHLWTLLCLLRINSQKYYVQAKGTAHLSNHHLRRFTSWLSLHQIWELSTSFHQPCTSTFIFPVTCICLSLHLFHSWRDCVISEHGRICCSLAPLPSIWAHIQAHDRHRRRVGSLPLFSRGQPGWGGPPKCKEVQNDKFIPGSKYVSNECLSPWILRFCDCLLCSMVKTVNEGGCCKRIGMCVWGRGVHQKKDGWTLVAKAINAHYADTLRTCSSSSATDILDAFWREMLTPGDESMNMALEGE